MSQLISALAPRTSLAASIAAPSLPAFTAGSWRWLVLAAIAAFALSSEVTAGVVAETLSEAYLAVSVFVAGTLLLLLGLERAIKEDLGSLLRRLERWQVPVAALLGAFPGCGGAIVIVTQYTRGTASFGALVATLTATMGDAMFLLLAREPSTGLLVFAVGIVVGTITGWVVDAFGRWPEPSASPGRQAAEASDPREPRTLGRLETAWLALALPGLALGLLGAFQIETDRFFGPLADFQPTLWLGVAGAGLSLWLWARNGNPDRQAQSCGSEGCARGPLERIVRDTCFITGWVVLAFLAFELPVHLLAIDLGAVFQLWAPIVPLLAVLVGWLPGCGPQILVTSLYLSGSLPLSAQLGNAISNDGDALFPALALAPRAALAATAVSSVPALLVGYATFLIIA